MVLTEEQFHELQQIVADYHSAFIVNNLGPNSVPKATLDRLKELGLVNVKTNAIEDAYVYGLIAGASNAPGIETYEDYKRHLKRNPVPLTRIEKQAISIASLSAAQYISGLGVRVAQSIATGVMQTDAEARQALRDQVRTQVEQGIESRASLAEVASDIGHATDDWTRDLRRVANFEVHDAVQRAVAQKLATDEGPGARVVRLASPDCCDGCARLYNNPDGSPKIFTVAELEANGTNVGRKMADWRPVAGSTHPNCRCGSHLVPEGMTYDTNRKMVPIGSSQKSMAPHGQVYFEPELFDKIQHF